jgi:hypothetical protein
MRRPVTCLLSVIAGFVCLPAGELRGAEAAPARLPAEIFFEPPAQLVPRLSPDGTKLGLLTRLDATHNELTLVDLATRKPRSLAKSPGWSVLNFWWKSDDLLLMIVENDDYVGGFSSLDLKAGKLNELPELAGIREVELINFLPADPENMLFRATRINGTQNDVVRINLRTGKKQVIERDPEGIEFWLCNEAGEVVAGWGSDADNYAHFLAWRTSPSDKWQRRWSTDKDFPPIEPLAVAADGRRLLVRDYRESSKGQVSYYDPATNRMGEQIAPARDMEPAGILRWGIQRELGAITYFGDRPQLHFLNAEMQNQHEWLEKKLPGTERSFLSFSRDNSRAVIYAYNDRNPGVYCLVNFQTQEVSVLAVVSKNLKPAQMAPSRPFTFTAGDGLPLTGRITLPVGVTKPPVIVRVGPSLQGSPTGFGFQQEDQFFANRGYATVRINHRGVRGFGRDFSLAGDYQVDTGMVQDVVAAVDWLKTQGWIDERRLAVLAHGEGGLVAFPLAVRPGFCKALVNFNSNIDTDVFSPARLTTSDRPREELLQAIGGRLAGEQYSAKVSPKLLLDQLAVPSWHYYYASSVMSSELRDRLKKLNRPFEMEIGRTLSVMKQEKIYQWQENAECFEKVAAFLDRHLAVP